MISIVMTYFDRLPQLLKTLESFEQYKVDFNVVICNDSDKPLYLPEKAYPLTIVNVENKSWVDNEPIYNQGIIEALKFSPDIIILQNAECAHLGGDILGYAIGNLNQKNYLSFACYSLSKENKVENYVIHNRSVKFDGDDGWYNHSLYRPKAYDFCAAITANNLIQLNGYDERLAYGWGYGDDNFLNRIRLLGLDVQIINNPYVVHQWHYTGSNINKKKWTEKNKKINQILCENLDYKARHLITNDL